MIMMSARLLDFEFGITELAQFFKRNKNMFFHQITGVPRGAGGAFWQISYPYLNQKGQIMPPHGGLDLTDI